MRYNLKVAIRLNLLSSTSCYNGRNTLGLVQCQSLHLCYRSHSLNTSVIPLSCSLLFIINFSHFTGSFLFLFHFYKNFRMSHLKHLPLILYLSLIQSHISFPIYSKTYLNNCQQPLSISSFPILFQCLS